MESKETILQQLQVYKDNFKDESKEANEIIRFVQQHTGDDSINRKNFNGHLTASAFIVNSSKQNVLMLKHKFLNRWLQPGGHIDATDNTMLDAALREAEEETGILRDELFSVSDSIFDIDSHAIPENVKKQEAAHTHHDIRFLFITSNDTNKFAESEATGSKWVSLEELCNDKSFVRVVKKLQREEL